MKIEYRFSSSEIEGVRAFVGKWSNDPFVKSRAARMVGSLPETFSRADFWEHMLACLLTSQQKSGPNGAVNRFLRQKPFPLSLSLCESNPQEAITEGLLQAGGIRFVNNIAKYGAINLSRMSGERWNECLSCLRSLKTNRTIEEERSVAAFFDERFAGFGPKQARNLLQSIGINKYETPIDSRIIKWMKKFDFPFPLDSTLLGNLEFYLFIEDAIQKLCGAAAEILPCILDAAVFASFDNGEWTEEIVANS